LFGDFNGIGAAYWIAWNAIVTVLLVAALWYVFLVVITVE
jgi:hypothetical protein